MTADKNMHITNHDLHLLSRDERDLWAALPLVSSHYGDGPAGVLEHILVDRINERREVAA